MHIQMCGLGPSCAGNTTASAQPFFEAALGGTGSVFCNAYGSCTNALVHNEKSNIHGQCLRPVGHVESVLVLDTGSHDAELTDQWGQRTTLRHLHEHEPTDAVQ